MRVLHVYKSYYHKDHGGIPQAIRHIINGCTKHGIKSEVFTLSRSASKDPIIFEGHTITEAQTTLEISSTPFSIEAFIKFRKLTPKFDLIHYHYPYPFGDLLHLYGAQSIPSIVTYHSDIIRQRFLKHPYYPLQTIFLNSVDRIVCTSKRYAETSNVLKKYHAKTEIISLGIDENNYPTPSHDTLSKWAKKINSPFILFLGALRDYKGIDTLIRSAKGFGGQIVIAGKDQNYKMHNDLLKKNNVNNVFLTGNVDEEDKSALLKLCNALVLPSHYRTEAFGIVLLEASLMAKPLICTELGTGTTHVNINNVTGLIVQPKNVDELRDAMNFLINNPEIAQNMGVAASNRFKQNFTAELMCERYATIYRDILIKNRTYS